MRDRELLLGEIDTDELGGRRLKVMRAMPDFGTWRPDAFAHANLAVVAPGIAEALLATAMGLVAAIPAVVIYNHFARQIGAYKALLADSSAAVLCLVSRDLSRGIAGTPDLHVAE